MNIAAFAHVAFCNLELRALALASRNLDYRFTSLGLTTRGHWSFADELDVRLGTWQPENSLVFLVRAINPKP